MRVQRGMWLGVLLLLCGLSSPVLAQQTDDEAALRHAILKAEAEKAQAEADKARAEADKARAEADIARTQADRSASQPEAAAPEKTGIHTHDGFFLRMAFGLGYEGFSLNDGVTVKNYPTIRSPDQHSFGSGFVFSLGGCPKENLAIHADFVATTPWNIEREPTRHLFASFGVGLGVTYYIMPDNIFVGGSFGVAGMTLVMLDEPEFGTTPHDERSLNGSGPFLALMAGKEWWVSDNWGIGLLLRGQYGMAFMPQNRLGHHGHALVMFTATYN